MLIESFIGIKGWETVDLLNSIIHLFVLKVKLTIY